MVYRNNFQGESLSRNYSASTTRLHATEMRTAPILLEVLRFIAIKITCKVLHVTLYFESQGNFLGHKGKIPLFFFLPNLHLNEQIFARNDFVYDILQQTDLLPRT